MSNVTPLYRDGSKEAHKPKRETQLASLDREANPDGVTRVHLRVPNRHKPVLEEIARRLRKNPDALLPVLREQLSRQLGQVQGRAADDPQSAGSVRLRREERALFGGPAWTPPVWLADFVQNLFSGRREQGASRALSASLIFCGLVLAVLAGYLQAVLSASHPGDVTRLVMAAEQRGYDMALDDLNAILERPFQGPRPDGSLQPAEPTGTAIPPRSPARSD